FRRAFFNDAHRFQFTQTLRQQSLGNHGDALLQFAETGGAQTEFPEQKGRPAFGEEFRRLGNRTERSIRFHGGKYSIPPVSEQVCFLNYITWVGRASMSPARPKMPKRRRGGA